MKLSKEFLEKYEGKNPFPNLMAEFVYFRTYSQWIDKLSRRENWGETLKRVAEYSGWLYQGPASDDELRSEIENMYDANFNLRWLPAGRTLWSGGTEHSYKNGGLSQFNCSFLVLDTIESFYELMYALCLGVGVGFSVEKVHTEKLPAFNKNSIASLPYSFDGYDSPNYTCGNFCDVKYEHDLKKVSIKVPDSKEGWADGVRQILTIASELSDYCIEVNLNSIRPEGDRIKGFGGKASGPVPYIGLLRLLNHILNNKESQRFKLRPIDVLDICNAIAKIIVAGGVRRCLPGEALVHMKNGLTQIKNVNIGELVMTNSGYKKVTNKFIQGEQSLVKVTTESGHFKCTPNHRVAVVKNVAGDIEWIEAGSLTPEMKLMAPAVHIDGIKTNLPAFNYEKPAHSTTCKDISIPELDTEIAWLLGMIFGDGYVYVDGKRGEISIACHSIDNPEIPERAKVVLERFGVNVALEKAKDENCIKVRVKSKQLALFMSQFKKPNEPLVVPDFIVVADVDIRSAFLAGLMDSDGAATNRPVSALVSVYENFIYQVQKLYSSLGIQTKICKTLRKETGWKDIYSLNILGIKAKNKYLDCVQKFSSKIVDKQTKPFKSYTIPHSMLDGVVVNSEDRVGVCLRNGLDVDLDVYEYKNDSLNFYPVSVVSVENSGSGETFDIEVEDVSCFYADGYLVHNSAQMCLFDQDDEEIVTAKVNFWENEFTSHRGMSNNSIHFWDKPVIKDLMDLIEPIKNSYEPGMYNASSASKRRVLYSGTNPCSEILLANKGVCNLVTVILTNHVNKNNEFDMKLLEQSFRQAVRHCLRVTNTDIELKPWDKTQKRDRLLGVSMTGVEDALDLVDTGLISDSGFDKRIVKTTDGNMTADEFKSKMNKFANQEAKRYAFEMRVPQPLLVCTIKPEGTISQLAGVSSGAHKNFGSQFRRRVRINRFDALAKVALEMGLRVYPEVGQGYLNSWNSLDQEVKRMILDQANTWVVEFPVKTNAKSNAFDEGALSQLNRYFSYQNNYADHSTSITISVADDEWESLFSEIHNHWDLFIGISFQNKSNDKYDLAPYELMTNEEYEFELSQLKDVDMFSLLVKAEAEGMLADEDLGSDCVGGACPIR